MATRKGLKSKHLASLVTGKKAPCAFCQRSVDDEITYGKLYAIGEIQCHYFCVLLSCCLIQKGKDEEGLFGFLYADILAEIERSKKHRCSYCQKGGATLGCSISQCRKQFHLPCGREKNAISLFYGNYKTFCQLHAPKQQIPEHIMAPVRLRRKAKKTNSKPVKRYVLENSEESNKQELEAVCVICYEEVDGFPTLNTFWPPCCARDAWFHRSCLQRMALSAGMHYLKCPLCNDKERFYEALVAQGFYVPDRDAAWELEQNAFAEIYERSLTCGAEECLCPLGRAHDADTGQWDMKPCILCGTAGVHSHCLPEGSAGRHVCASCRPAAPDHDALERLAATIEAVILEEQARSAQSVRSGPIMPSRMSLRRTKLRAPQNMPSTSRSDSTLKTDAEDLPRLDKVEVALDTPSSRLELNLKTPKRPTRITEKPTPIEPNVLKDIENILPSPIKLLEQGLSEKIRHMGVRETELDTDQVLEGVRETFKKPRPLSEKKRIINDILDSLFDNVLKEAPKSKEPIKEWSTPKKCCDINKETVEESMQENTEPATETIRTPTITLKLIEVTTELPKNTQETLEIIDNYPIIDLESPENAKECTIQDLVTLASKTTPERDTEENVKEEIDKEPCPESPNHKTTPVKGTEGNVDEEIDKESCLESPYHNTTPVKDTEGNVKEEIAKETCLESPNNKTTPVKDSERTLKEEIDKETCLKSPNHKEDSCSNSTFELPAEFVADHHSDDSLTLFETPKKLKTVEIEKDSSLEISANDEVVNVDILKMNSNDNTSIIETLNIKSPVKSKKSTFKFSPLNKDNLETVNIDIESFKSQYLNEVDKFKCGYEHKHKHNQSLNSSKSIRTAIDFAVEAYKKEIKNVCEINILKRKLEELDAVEKKRQKENKCDLEYKNNLCIKSVGSKDVFENKEIIDLSVIEDDNGTKITSKRKNSKKLSTHSIDLSLDGTQIEKSKKNHRNLKKRSISEIDLTVDTEEGKKKFKKLKNKRQIQVKIRWKKEQLRPKRTESKVKKKGSSNMKQYILNPETSSAEIVMVKPENDVVLKRKYVKQDKSPDNLKQTSIHSFFKLQNS